MKTIRIILTMLLTVAAYSSLAQGYIIYKSNGTQEKLPYIAVDSITLYFADQAPVPLTEAKAVDLGLPSGTLWADINVGATAPETLGGYYAYGETEEKATYSWDSYMCNSSSKCCTDSDPLFADGLLTVRKSLGVTLGYECDIAGSKYDVATQKMGESWVMPNRDQFRELFNNCTRNTVKINDVWCAEFTGPNGNTLIMPYETGYKQNAYLEEDFFGYYWTSVISNQYEVIHAWMTSTGQSAEGYNRLYRYCGLQVRAVKKQEQ